MVDTDWTVPETNGSYWPASKNGSGEKREIAEIIRLKQDYRRDVMLREMSRLGINELVYKHDHIQNKIERAVEHAVDERIRERDLVESPVVESAPAPASVESIQYAPSMFDEIEIDFGTHPTIH